MRANPTVIGHLTGVKATADMGSSAATQVMAKAMLRDYHTTRAWRKDALARSLSACTATLTSLVPEWRWQTPHGGPHLWIELPDTDAMAFSQLMLRNGVALIAGPLLAVNEGIAASHIRIPYYREPSVLERALKQMAVVWKTHRG